MEKPLIEDIRLVYGEMLGHRHRLVVAVCDYALSLEADRDRWKKIALRRNQSGCCCKIGEEGDRVIEACALHREWKEVEG